MDVPDRGYGMGTQVWREIVSTLRAVGYDGVLSIEHEDPLRSIDEGMAKGVRALREILISEPPPTMWWA